MLHIDVILARNGRNEMTDKECAEWLQAIKEKYIHGGDEGFDAKRREAIDHAIE